MSTYPLVSVKDIVKIHYGKALKTKDRIESGSVPVFGANGQIGFHDVPLIDFPTLVIGRKGSAGEVTYTDCGGWVIDTAFYTEINKPDETDIRYLFYALKRANFENLTITTSIPGVNRDSLYSKKIPLPPLEEQKRIAAILDKADAIRRKRKQAIALTEELLRSTFLDMFGDPVTNPKGWEKDKISKLGQVITGNTPPRANPENYGNDIEWIKSDNITTHYHFLTKAAEKLSSQGKKMARVIPSNSILVVCIAGSRSSIGRAALTDREVAFNQQINAIIPNSDVDPYFLYTQFFVGQHLVQAKSTDSMKGLVSKSKFSSIQFIRPPEQKQREFGKWFSRFYTWSNNLHQDEQFSDNLFNSLLQKAFRGEL